MESESDNKHNLEVGDERAKMPALQEIWGYFVYLSVPYSTRSKLGILSIASKF